MLEILLIVFMCRRIGTIMRQKGRRPVWFQIALVLLWFGGEIGGGLAAAVFQAMTGPAGSGGGMQIYLCALLGAGTGAGMAFLIAKSAAPAAEMPTNAFPVIPTQPIARMEERIG